MTSESEDKRRQPEGRRRIDRVLRTGLVWAVIGSYVVGIVVSTALGIYIIRVNRIAVSVRDDTCVLVRTIEIGADREAKLVRTSTRAQARRAHLTSAAVLNRLAAQLREHVGCPPRHM